MQQPNHNMDFHQPMRLNLSGSTMHLSSTITFVPNSSRLQPQRSSHPWVPPEQLSSTIPLFGVSLPAKPHPLPAKKTAPHLCASSPVEISTRRAGKKHRLAVSLRHHLVNLFLSVFFNKGRAQGYGPGDVDGCGEKTLANGSRNRRWSCAENMHGLHSWLWENFATPLYKCSTGTLES
jgi:hypothetical protein